MSLMDKVLGRPLASHESDEQKIGPFAGVPMLGLDGLASAAYGPEAAMTALLPLGALGLMYLGPITAILLGLLAILYLSYRQTMAAYPTGGGSYTVSRENLGVRFGLLAAAALLLDYILVVAVGISAGVGALISTFPGLHSFRLLLCLLILGVVTLVNLRGAKESGVVFALPTYGFIVCLMITLLIGIGKTFLSGGTPVPVVTPPAIGAGMGPLAGFALIWLLMHAFASGCTAMTGVEAVSNGMPAFRAPVVANAQRTLTIIVVTLGVLLAGIAYLAKIYHIGATPPEGSGYESVLSQLVAAVVGKGWFYYGTQATVLLVLALSANTGFADFPRLCRLVAEDDYLPHAFANRGRRLVYSLGISILAAFTALLLILFGGVTDRLIPLFAIGAFGAFTLSQAGMVVYWQGRRYKRGARQSQWVNGFGACVTAVALIVVLLAKFREGAWITMLLIPATLFLFYRVRSHYVRVARETGRAGELDVARALPPIIVLPVKSWNTITERALRFALPLSDTVIGVHISAEDTDAKRLQAQWEKFVVAPCQAAQRPPPELRLIRSPYRRLFTPLMDFITELKAAYPDRTIAVIIPELVETQWYEYLLHNQRATGLKAALLLRGGERVTVINVPWYLGRSKSGRAALLP